MSDPLEALKKAQSIQPAPPPEREGLRGVLDTGMGALRGLVGLGDDSKAARFGEMVQAGLPLLGGVSKLSPMLEELFAAHPGARAIYDAAHAPQVEDVFISRAGQSLVDSNRLEKAKNALMNLDEGYPSPIPTKTGMEYAVPKPPPPRVTPPAETKFGLSPDLDKEFRRLAAGRAGLASRK